VATKAKTTRLPLLPAWASAFLNEVDAWGC